MGEGGEIVEVCTVDLKCLKELLNSRGHEVRKEHEEIAERKKSAFFFSLLPLLLASGTMGIEMAIAPLWVKGKRE